MDPRERSVNGRAVRSGTDGGAASDRLWAAAGGVAAVFLVGFIVVVAVRDHGPAPVRFPVAPPSQVPVGDPAPGFTLARLGGGPPVTLASDSGVPTVVNFFASWCRDCRAELSAIGHLAAGSRGRFAVVGVDTNDGDPVTALRLLAGARATYPVGIDADASVASSYRLTALPVTYFLDARGRVVHASFGAQSLSQLLHWTDRLIPQAAS